MQWLHKQKKFTAKDLNKPAVKKLIDETSAVFVKAVDENIKSVKPTDKLINDLKRSGWLFSGFKTVAQMTEAASLLYDENGDIKPFERFLNDVKKIDETYNENYLNAEYKFAVASAQMADKWIGFIKKGDRYDLQYRTAGDERVRETHERLHNITLPVDSIFWLLFYPPNGWGCRCTVVLVRKGKYPLSDLGEAMALGYAATAGKHEDMFRFNPGATGDLFPTYNPYTSKTCVECAASGYPNATNPPNEICAACPVLRSMANNEKKIRTRRKEILVEAKKKLPGTVISHKDFHKEILVSGNSIKEFLNQPHKHIEEKNELLLDIENVIAKCEYKGITIPYKEKQDFDSHIFETIIAGEKSWIIIREYNDGKAILYSISDSKNVMKWIKNK